MHPLLRIQERAVAAASDDAEAIRRFTDEVFAQSLFAETAPSVKERLFKNERAFRADQSSGVTEQEVVAAINEQVRLFDLPAYMRVNLNQLHAHRRHLRTYVRHYAKSDPTRGEPPIALSPAEAMFVTAHLILQKLHNPQYQVEPEQWERDVASRRAQAQARRAQRTSEPPASRFVVSAAPAGRPYAAVMRALPDESGEVVSGIHAFLDAIGFQR